jgi:hypothetical protein
VPGLRDWFGSNDGWEQRALNEEDVMDESNTLDSPPPLSCPWCGHSVRFGLRVCAGCNADVVYGATRRELTQALKVGFVLGFFGAFVFDKIVGGFSSMTSAFVSGLSVVGVVSVGCAVLVFVLRRGKPRFFRRTAL